MKEEIWKDIQGYEGLYQISNMGRVKSVERTAKNGRGYRTVPEKIMKPYKNSDGYLQVGLYKDDKGKKYYVHRLVADTFLENPEEYTEVNHRDEDKENNRADNLEWCSRSYNNNYGTKNKRISEKNTNNPKISKAVIGINKVSGLILEFPSTKEASRQLGIPNSQICACLKGRRKSTGGYVWYYAEQ